MLQVHEKFLMISPLLAEFEDKRLFAYCRRELLRLKDKAIEIGNFTLVQTIQNQIEKCDEVNLLEEEDQGIDWTTAGIVFGIIAIFGVVIVYKLDKKDDKKK